MLTETASRLVRDLVAAKKQLPGALLPILHDIQDALGYIPAQAVAEIAQQLNLSRAEVHGVVSYYHFFRQEPAGRQRVQLCRAEACQSMGADQLWSHACERLGCAEGTRADGAVTLESVYCLGLCAAAPAMRVDEALHARVNADTFDRLVGATGGAT